MTHHWDELSKSLAEESLPRRESLRRIGTVLAGAVLSPLGLESAFARGPDPCKAFCRCRNKSQQNDCVASCRACNNDPRRLCGTCGSYVCCREPGPWEYGACIDGYCEYACAEGAVYCDGACTFLGWDPANCGECGYVCGGSFPYCHEGECSACPPALALCGNSCVDLAFDSDNCGSCGTVCGAGTTCQNGTCQPNNCVPNCPTNWCGGDGCGGECGCPADSFCMGDGSNMCVPCDGACP